MAPSSGQPRLIELMAVVATLALVFAAHRSLNVALDGSLTGLAVVPTGMLIFLAAAHALLTSLGRRHDWAGLDESRSFLLVMLLAVGLPTTVFSSLASPAAGILYLMATLVMFGFSAHRR